MAAVCRTDRRGRCVGVDQAGAVVDVDAHRRRSRVSHRERCGDERVRRYDHLVAWRDAGRLQHDAQRGVPDATPTQYRVPQ